VAWFVALVAVALRVPGLFQSLWIDEVFRTFVGLSGESARHLILRDVHNPLYNLIMYSWIRVFGDSEIAIRVPSLLAATALIWMVWRWAGARFSARAGGLAAAMMAVSPVAVWYSTEAKNNIFTVLFSTLGVMMLDGAMRTRSLPRTALAALFVVLALVTDAQSLLVLVPVGVIVAWISLRRAPAGGLSWGPTDAGAIRRTSPVLLCALAAAVVITPWAIYKAGHASELSRRYVGYFDWHEPIRLLVLWFPTGGAIAPLYPERPGAWFGDREGWALRALLVAPLVLPPLARGVRMLKGSPSGVVTLGAILWPMVLMFVISEALVLSGSPMRIYQPRNLLVVLPWFCILTGAGLAAIPPGPLRLVRTLLPLVLSLCCTVAIRTIRADAVTVNTPNPDWRGALRWIDAEDATSPLPVVSNSMVQPIAYYAPGRDSLMLPGRAPLSSELATMAAGSGFNEFWYIHNPHWGFRVPPEELRAALERYHTLDAGTFRSLQVFRLRRE
jgi:4-amino-4-deoxy-L-arabinose transferase-like glycosyltransferase